jgi:hypothetical protein
MADERARLAMTGASLGAFVEQSLLQAGEPPPRPIAPAAAPAAPGTNPLKSLPFPSPGDRIKADDIKKLSQSLTLIRDTFSLSSALLGRSFGEVKLVLTSQQYSIQRVMSVFGNEIGNLGDPALDTRRVIQVVPMELGERGVAVIVTEAVETRRMTPNLAGLSYREASERLNGVLGDVSVPSTPMSAVQLVGHSLQEAKLILPG